MKISGLINEEYVNTVICKRPKDIHKGDCGKILIVAGSREMAGAAVFTSKAAIKTGSGLVKVCIPREVFPVIQISVPEAICMDREKTKGDLSQYDAIAIGPGMGVGKETNQILREILEEYDKTIVIDADGLNEIAEDEALQALVKTSKARIIITPHIGEAKRLTRNQQVDYLSKKSVASALMKTYNTVTVVKGNKTLVALSEEKAYTNTTGNPGMATAGSGDVLTGIITSLAGQGLEPFDAARAGVFVHGLAGDLAAEKVGEYGLTASDIVENVPFAMKKFTF